MTSNNMMHTCITPHCPRTVYSDKTEEELFFTCESFRPCFTSRPLSPPSDLSSRNGRPRPEICRPSSRIWGPSSTTFRQVSHSSLLLQIYLLKSTSVGFSDIATTQHFLFLISKPVFEHWTAGDATPTNQSERQCWVVAMSENSTKMP